jgi:rare lipoprotein A
VLVVNDRGPFIKDRIIDVSTGAADVLGFRWAGVVRVTVETVAD